MSANQTCPQCGSPVMGDDVQGLCPTCLAALALGVDDGPSAASPSPGSPAKPPVAGGVVPSPPSSAGERRDEDVPPYQKPGGQSPIPTPQSSPEKIVAVLNPAALMEHTGAMIGRY